MEIVSGIQQFERAFSAFSDSFIVIGGSACRAVLSDGPIQPRRTRDIDMDWIYGHSHRNIDKQIGVTQFVSNQLGYVFANEHNSFNSSRCIDL